MVGWKAARTPRLETHAEKKIENPGTGTPTPPIIMFPPDKMQISFRKNLFTGLPGLGEFEQKQRGLCSTIDQACRDGEIFRKEMWDSNDGKKEVS